MGEWAIELLKSAAGLAAREIRRDKTVAAARHVGHIVSTRRPHRGLWRSAETLIAKVATRQPQESAKPCEELLL